MGRAAGGALVGRESLGSRGGGGIFGSSRGLYV